MPVIRCSPSGAFFKTGYTTKYNWTCFAQCGGSGEKGNTFFFEAFPELGMIRADSVVSMEDAEEKAWARHQKTLACILDHKDHNNLDRKYYENGCSFCKGCNQYIAPDYSGLPPTTVCAKCGIATYYSRNNKQETHCEKCLNTLPDSDLTEWQLDKRYKRGLFAVKKVSPEEFNNALKDVIGNLLKK